MHQGLSGLGLGYVGIMRPCRFPRADNDLRLAEYGSQLVNHRRLDFTSGHATHRTGARAVYSLKPRGSICG